MKTVGEYVQSDKRSSIMEAMTTGGYPSNRDRDSGKSKLLDPGIPTILLYTILQR